MEERNKILALKNTQLKEEIKKLNLTLNNIKKENIKESYLNNRNNNKLIELIDDNISSINEVLLKYKEIKEIVDYRGSVLKDKDCNAKKGRKKRERITYSK